MFCFFFYIFPVDNLSVIVVMFDPLNNGGYWDSLANRGNWSGIPNNILSEMALIK